MIDPVREWETWQAWLGQEPTGTTIYVQVAEMVLSRQVWDGFAIVHDQAPEGAREDGTYLWWVRFNYARSQGLAIRRQVEPRSDVVSLGRLIDHVWRYPTVLSRERFVAMQVASSGYEDEAHRWFDSIAGTGRDFINPETPARDMHDLIEKTAKVRKWVNKSVAHLSERRPAGPPLTDLHQALEDVATLFQKYAGMILGAHIMIEEVIMQPWVHIFRPAWIGSDDDLRAVMETLDEQIRRRRGG